VSSLQKEEKLKPARAKTGIFSVGSSTIELLPQAPRPIPRPPILDQTSWLPDQISSLVTPSGIGDLIVARNHIIRYEGGEIGNIENVLK
jgi:hypothetical protein